MRSFVLLISLAITVSIFVASAQESITDLTIPVSKSPPKIDGILNDACWQEAVKLDSFRLIGKESQNEPKHKVYVTCDKEWLYVGFSVEQLAHDSNPVQYLIHDDYVQREDNVQVSFDPGTKGETYYQFLLNRGNTRADFRMTKEKGRDREGWNIPWRSAVQNTEKGWTAEIALPFCLMLQVGDVKNAKFNVIIDNFIPQRDRMGVKMEVLKKEYSWAPVSLQFHEPDKFGRIKGLDNVEFEAPFLPFVNNAAITGYQKVEGRNCYGVKAMLSSCSGRAGKAELEVQERLSDGKTNTVSKIFDLGKNTKEFEAVVFVPAASLEKREVSLLLKNPESGEILQKIGLADVSALDLFSVFMDRNYYTSEKNAYAVSKIRLPESELVDMQLKAIDASGKTIAYSAKLAQEYSLAVPMDKIKNGKSIVEIQLCYKDGKIASSIKLDFIKREPRESEWKIDRERNCFLKNGEPFFPFGLIMYGVTADREDCFKDVSDAGFNSILQWGYRPDGPKDVDNYLSNADKYGLNVIAINDVYCDYSRNILLDENKLLTPEQLKKSNEILKTSYYPLAIGMKDVLLEVVKHLKVSEQFLLYEEFYRKCEPELVAAMEHAKTHRNLSGYFILDEPCDGTHGAGKLYYDKIYEVDGYHPVFVLYSSYIDNPELAVTWGDAIGTDPYWNFGKGDEHGNVNFVSKIVTMTKRIADKSHKVTWTVPVAESWSQTWKRIITPAEQRCQTYLALISGSKGIMYFNYGTIYTHTNWQTLSALAKEMKILGACCLMPDIQQEVKYSPGTLEPEKNTFTDVQAILKRHPDGRYVLLAVNTANYPVETEYSISLLGEKGKVATLFDSKTYAVNNGAFKDVMEPYADRAYVFSTDAKIKGSVKIAVNMKADKSKKLQEEAQIELFNGRPGKKNILPNASMEAETIKGKPDYWSMSSTPLRAEQRIGAREQGFGISTESPFHGKKCLLVDGNAEKFSRIPLIEVGVINDRETTYTFSAYLRAGRDGVASEIGTHGGGKFTSKNITLDKEWKRYSHTFTVPAGQQRIMGRFFFGSNGNRKDDEIWIDAAQIEKGSVPTEFEE